MRRLHLAIIVLVLWLSLLFSLEQFAPSLQLVPFLYVFIPIAAVLTIWLMERDQRAFPWIFAVALPIYAVLKYRYDNVTSQMDLLHVFIELSAIGITLLLCSAVGRRLAAVRTTLANLSIGQIDEEIAPFEQGQSVLYREVRRARRHQHSLALLAVAVPEEPKGGSILLSSGVSPSLPVTVELQREFSKKFILTRVGRLLLDKLDDAAIVTQSGDHFVVLLPETSSDELQAVLKALQAEAQEKLGMKLNVGSATFPNEEITFESLLERAEATMVDTSSASTAQAHTAAPAPSALELAPVDRGTNISPIS